MVATQKDGVIDFVAWELDLVGQRIKQVLALETLGHHALHMGQP